MLWVRWYTSVWTVHIKCRKVSWGNNMEISSRIQDYAMLPTITCDRECKSDLKSGSWDIESNDEGYEGEYPSLKGFRNSLNAERGLFQDGGFGQRELNLVDEAETNSQNTMKLCEKLGHRRGFSVWKQLRHAIAAMQLCRISKRRRYCSFSQLH